MPRNSFGEASTAQIALCRLCVKAIFPDISVKEIGFLEQFKATGRSVLRLLKSAARRFSSNLQRRGFSLSSNTPSREEGREGSEQFRRKIGDKLNPGGKILSFVSILIESLAFG